MVGAGAARRGRGAGLAAASSAFRAISRPSSRCAFLMSPSYFRITFSVSFTSASSSAVAFSASSARAQSSVSLIDGVFLRSSLRSRCITPTSSSASRWPTPGTLVSRMRVLELGVREVDVEVQAAALQRVAHLARVVRGEEDERLGLRVEGADLGHAHLEVRQHLEQERLELRVGLVDLVDQQQVRRLGGDRLRGAAAAR